MSCRSCRQFDGCVTLSDLRANGPHNQGPLEESNLFIHRQEVGYTASACLFSCRGVFPHRELVCYAPLRYGGWGLGKKENWVGMPVVFSPQYLAPRSPLTPWDMPALSLLAFHTIFPTPPQMQSTPVKHMSHQTIHHGFERIKNTKIGGKISDKIGGKISDKIGGKVGHYSVKNERCRCYTGRPSNT